MTNELCLPADVVKSLNEFEAKLSRFDSEVSSSSSNGRLLYIVDATLSRGRYWERAQCMMNDVFSSLGSRSDALSVQLCWFLGTRMFHSRWHKNPESIKKIMGQVSCEGGDTQIAKALKYAAEESKKEKIDVVVYVGDSCEESRESVVQRAMELKETGSRLFLLDDKDHTTCRQPSTEQTFMSMCKMSGGIYTAFDEKAVNDLKEFFRVSAAFATGGKRAVRALPDAPKTNLGKALVQNILALE